MLAFATHPLIGTFLRHNYWAVASPLSTVLGMDPIRFHVAHPKL